MLLRELGNAAASSNYGGVFLCAQGRFPQANSCSSYVLGYGRGNSQPETAQEERTLTDDSESGVDCVHRRYFPNAGAPLWCAKDVRSAITLVEG